MIAAAAIFPCDPTASSALVKVIDERMQRYVLTVAQTSVLTIPLIFR